MRNRSLIFLVGVAGAAVAISPALARPPSTHHSKPRTWYVRAGARQGGAGTRRRPFGTLAAVEAAAGPGATIVIEPASKGFPPLNGGIALKRGQRLIGGGPPVAGRTGRLKRLPVITNTNRMSLAGDAVRLADHTTVRNLVVRGAYRGDIYGVDSVGVKIIGNDVSAQNTSCTKGFLVQPFNIPTGIPSVNVPASPAVAPQNGWAGVMVDGRAAAGSVRIERNFVHDGACGDGIDIRAMGSSRLSATVSRNTVTRLPQRGTLTSVLAIGMQALDSARLTATQERDTETNIGSTGADCEGQFANTAGAGVIVDSVDHNTFRHAIGGMSCNGFETIVSSGDGTIETTLRNSTFADSVGDMFEEGNLGAGSTMRFVADRVVADGTSVRGGNPPGSSDGGTNPIPFNIGDCMVGGDDGAGDSTTFVMTDSVFEHCNNGISFGNNAGAANGSGPARELVADISHSVIAGNAKYGLHVYNGTPLDSLHVRVWDTNINGNAEPGASFEAEPQGTVRDGRLDLGGGTLASPGGNCLYGNGRADAEATALSVIARDDWWGHSGAPVAGQIATRLGGTVTTHGGLASRPGCGVRPAPRRKHHQHRRSHRG